MAFNLQTSCARRRSCVWSCSCHQANATPTATSSITLTAIKVSTEVVVCFGLTQGASSVWLPNHEIWPAFASNHRRVVGRAQPDFFELTAAFYLHQPGGSRKTLLRPLVQHIDDFDQAVSYPDRAGIKHQVFQPFIRIQASFTLPSQRQKRGFACVARNILVLRGNVGRRVITLWRRQVLRTRLT